MYNHNIRARPKKTEEKKPAWQVKKERMFDLLDLIQDKKELKCFDAQIILQWGDGVFERILREVLAYFSNEIRFDKEKRELTHISVDPYPKQLDVKNEIPTKPGLSDNELNIMHTIKQEVHK